MTLSSEDTGSAPGRLSKPIRLLLIVAVAPVLGPLIGSAPFLLVISVQLVLSGQGAAEIAGAFIPVVMAAYFLGGGIAFVAGAIVAITAVWRQPTFGIIIAATLTVSSGTVPGSAVSYPFGIISSMKRIVSPRARS